MVKRARETHEDLCKKQELNLTSPSTEHLESENEALAPWEFVAGLEESFLKQRSKLHWLNIGDQNNKTFHSAITAREAVNGIREIRCRDGTLVNDENGIKEEAESFFREFLQYQPHDFTGMTVEHLKDLLSFRCNDQDAQALIKTVTPEEI